MDFKKLVGLIVESVFDPLAIIIVGLAVLYFLIGILKYIQSVDNEEKRKEGATMITYGVIALFVMIAIWGLVHVLQNTFRLDPTPIKPPSTTGP